MATPTKDDSATPRSTVRFVHSLSGRMLLLGLLPNALILAGIIIWLATSMAEALRAQNEQSMRILADRVAAEIDRGNTRAVVIAQIMATAQAEGLFGDREASVAYASQVLEDFSQLTGAYFGYEPNADGQDAAPRPPGVPAEALAESGRFIPYWFRDRNESDQLRLEPLVDMDTSLYYQGCKELFLKSGRPLPMVTEPYIYVGKMIVEQTYPIVIDGQFRGIAGVDRALSDILEFLEEIKARDGVDLFLVSRSGRFVAATTEEAVAATSPSAERGEETGLLRTRTIAETPYAHLIGPLHDDRTESRSVLAEDPIDGGRHYFVSSPVPTGEWMIVLRQDEASILAPVRAQLVIVAGLLASGLLVVLGISLWITQSTARRIGRTVRAADRLALGDISVDTEPMTRSRDETGQLASAFDRVIDAYREITRLCIAVAEGDFSRSFPRRSEEDALADALNEMSEKRRLAEAEVLRARDAAEEANRSKSDFLARMSHELRTPMNAIIGYSEMLEEDAEDTGQQEFVADLKKIQSASRHLLSLINDILDLSKVEAGKMDLLLERFEVIDVVQAVGSTIQPLADKNGNTLIVDCDPAAGTMFSDLVKLRQSLFNLLSNACKFTKAGQIRLSVERLTSSEDEERLRFSVSDSGVGMTQEQMDRIFEAFTQADSSTTREFGGTGLGLTITRRFTELLGGTIDVTSEYGTGSTFTIELPAESIDPASLPVESTEGPPATRAETASEANAEDSDALRVLVVDDDPAARDLLRRHLEREGFNVTTASSGEECLRQARALQPAAITLDVMMPGLDGWAVLQALKADPETVEIPVFVVTVLQDGSLAYSLGATGFLSKPVERDALRALLMSIRDEKGHALVVEDDPNAREVLTRQLEREGWRVRSAQHGQEGLDQLQEEMPDVVLLDLMMPVMDGFEFIDRVRSDPDTRKLPIVVISAKSLTPEERQFLEGSTQRLFSKASGRLEDLVSEITHWIGDERTPDAIESHEDSSRSDTSS